MDFSSPHDSQWTVARRRATISQSPRAKTATQRDMFVDPVREIHRGTGPGPGEVYNADPHKTYHAHLCCMCPSLARFYCTECKDYFCRTCGPEAHDSITALKFHPMLCDVVAKQNTRSSVLHSNPSPQRASNSSSSSFRLHKTTAEKAVQARTPESAGRDSSLWKLMMPRPEGQLATTEGKKAGSPPKAPSPRRQSPSQRRRFPSAPTGMRNANSTGSPPRTDGGASSFKPLSISIGSSPMSNKKGRLALFRTPLTSTSSLRRVCSPATRRVDPSPRPTALMPMPTPETERKKSSRHSVLDDQEFDGFYFVASPAHLPPEAEQEASPTKKDKCTPRSLVKGNGTTSTPPSRSIIGTGTPRATPQRHQQPPGRKPAAQQPTVEKDIVSTPSRKGIPNRVVDHPKAFYSSNTPSSKTSRALNMGAEGSAQASSGRRRSPQKIGHENSAGQYVGCYISPSLKRFENIPDCVPEYTNGRREGDRWWTGELRPW